MDPTICGRRFSARSRRRATGAPTCSTCASRAPDSAPTRRGIHITRSRHRGRGKSDSMLLNPYRVIDLTDPLGFVAGKVLADLGADVIKIEPEGGDPSRAWRDGLYWAAMNAGKRSVTLNLDSGRDQIALRELTRDADFVVESFRPGRLDERGLGYTTLCCDNPRLIMVSITPFGQLGPYAHFEASDLEIMALSGAMGLAGDAGGEPMRVTAPQAPYWVGVEAAMGALTALAYRTTTGR